METKHPLKSQTVIAGYITIIIALARIFGFIGPNDNVNVTIDTMDQPHQTSKEDTAGNLALAGAGIFAIKGRYQANSNIKRLGEKEGKKEDA